MIPRTNDPRRVVTGPPAGSEHWPVILLYHRVTTLSSDPQLLSVTPKQFADHLDVLKRYAHPISLSGLTDGVEERSIHPRSVAITFDDGYADSLERAKPLLEAVDVPATVFVVTGNSDGRHEFWWDELERILFETETLPETFSLSLVGERYEWRSEDSVTYGSEEREQHRGWSILEKRNPTGRHRLYRELFERLRPLSDGKRWEALHALLDWADQDSIVRPTHRMLSAEQLVELASDGLIDIGAHTVTHPILSLLSIEDQRAEIAGSKTYLESVLGRAVTEFSYPFGTRRDYTAETVTLVRESGFHSACSNYPGLVRPGVDRFQLPRLLVRDWDGDTFLRHLEEVWCVA